MKLDPFNFRMSESMQTFHFSLFSARASWIARFTGLLAAVWVLSTLTLSAERVMSFNGTGTVTLPPVAGLKFGASNDFALELWLKPNNASSELGAVFTGDNFAALTGSGTNGGWGLYWQSGGLRVVRKPSTSAVNNVALGGVQGPLVPAAAGVWHHVTVNFKRTGNLTLYVDGVLQETSTDPYASWAYFQRTFDSAEPYRMGADPSGGNAFKGSIDEVRIWGRVRTAQEIANSWQQRPALNGTEQSLLAYYTFNESSGPAVSQGSLGAPGQGSVGVGPVRIDDSTLTLSPALPSSADYAFTFNGSNQSIETTLTGDKVAGSELTIEYWFKGGLLQSAVRLQVGTLWIVSGWSNPSRHIVNTSGTNNQEMAVAHSGKNVNDGLWHHVAMTWKSGSSNGFIAYFDGFATGLGLTTPAVQIPAIPASVWIGSYNGTSEFLNGTLDEVRIWNRVLTPSEIQERGASPRRLIGTDPQLLAYFPFNDAEPNGTRDVVSKQLALFRGMSAANRVVQDGVSFGDPAIRTLPNPSAAGLWLGEVSLKSVNEVNGTSTNLTSAGGQFDFNILLHADAAGNVRLLKDVTIMQKRNSVSNLTEVVLLTDDSQIPNYDGVLKRSGKLVGIRYSSAFYQFDGQSLPVAGGLGFGYRVAGTNTVPASLPTNPFRHKFHPQHKNPTDLRGVPYDLAREIEITLNTSGKLSPSDGRDRFKGVYRETLRGLHKSALVTEGEISLERVSLVNKLNNQ